MKPGEYMLASVARAAILVELVALEGQYYNPKYSRRPGQVNCVLRLNTHIQMAVTNQTRNAARYDALQQRFTT